MQAQMKHFRIFPWRKSISQWSISFRNLAQDLEASGCHRILLREKVLKRHALEINFYICLCIMTQVTEDRIKYDRKEKSHMH